MYDARHVNWLDLMDRLRRTGMSIAQMREYTVLVKQGKGTLRERQALLAAHRRQVKARIGAWQTALRLIDRKIDFYGAWLATGVRPRERPGVRRASEPPPRRGPRRR